MKKRNLKKLAWLGITGGVIVASQSAVKAHETADTQELMAASCGGKGASCSHQSSCGGTRGYIADAEDYTRTDAGQLMTEDQLMSQLNEQSKQMYRNMSPEGKTLAIKLASRTCKGTNDCKGQGACNTAEHNCAGKNECSGTSKCAFRDKNLAIKIAAQKQAEKRAKMNSGSY